MVMARLTTRPSASARGKRDRSQSGSGVLPLTPAYARAPPAMASAAPAGLRRDMPTAASAAPATPGSQRRPRRSGVAVWAIRSVVCVNVFIVFIRQKLLDGKLLIALVGVVARPTADGPGGRWC